MVARPRQRHADLVLDPPGPVGHHEHAIGDEDGLLDVVRHEQHGQAVPLPDVGQELLHDAARERVERTERLVHQQQAGSIGERARDRDPLLHAARELARLRVGELVEPDERQQLVGARALLGARQLLAAQRELDVAARAQPGEQRVLLEDDAAVAARPLHGPAVDLHDPRARLRQAGDDREQRALAAARGADERHELVLGDLQVGAFSSAVTGPRRVGKTLPSPAIRSFGPRAHEARAFDQPKNRRERAFMP